jgi:hypothetical protein
MAANFAGDRWCESSFHHCFFFNIFYCFEDFRKSFRHHGKRMVPAKGIRDEPICERVSVIVRPSIPMAVARPLNPPQEFLSALAAPGIFDHGHNSSPLYCVTGEKQPPAPPAALE